MFLPPQSTEIAQVLDLCLETIMRWMRANKLNSSKTEVSSVVTPLPQKLVKTVCLHRISTPERVGGSSEGTHKLLYIFIKYKGKRWTTEAPP